MRDWDVYVRGRLRLNDVAEDKCEKIARELAGQLEEFYQASLASGLSAEEALEEAGKRMGDWEQLSVELSRCERIGAAEAAGRRIERLEHDIRRQGQAGDMFAGMLQDLRCGLRGLKNHPGFAAAAILTLAIAVGANTAVFSVLNAVLLRPLPYPESDRLVAIYNGYTKINPDFSKYGFCCNAGADYFDRREETGIFESLAVFDFKNRSVGSEDSLRRLTGLRITPSFFSVFRIAPLQGRTFAESEVEIGNEQVVILSYGLWQGMFAGAGSAIGQSLRIDGVAHKIVGVMPKGFDLFSRAPDLLVPLALTDQQKEGRHGNFAYMVARLKPGVASRLAQERMRALDAKNLERFPHLRSFVERSGYTSVVAGLHEIMVRPVRPMLYILQAGVALVLLIGCVNIANLLLIRCNGRKQELAVRIALGARRRRVIRQLMTESLLLASIGGIAGLSLAIMAKPALGRLGADKLPKSGEIGIDAAVLVFAAAAVVATGLIFGTLPSLVLARSNVGDVLRRSGWIGWSGRSESLARNALAVAEVSLAFVLLNGATLLLASFVQLLSVHPGFDPKGVMTARLSLPASRYADEEAIWSFAERIGDALAALPGVGAAGLTTVLPVSGDGNKSVVTVEGYEPAPGESAPTPHNSWVSGGYFAAMGIPLLEGRSFDERDSPEAPPVAVVDRVFAAHYWPGRSPIGRRLHRGGGSGTWLTLVGVVGDSKFDDLEETNVRGAVYFSQTQPAARNYLPLRRELSLVLKAEASELSLGDALRAAVRELDPELPLYDIRGMEGRLSESLAARRVPMILLLSFAGVALLLASIGIYGVLSYGVSQRTREFGINIALGAAPRRIMKRVLWQGLRLILVGLAAGFLGSFWLMRLLAGALYGVVPTDGYVLAAVAAVLAAVAAAACVIPARRAMRVDVAGALRCE
jgi:predicted permease